MRTRNVIAVVFCLLFTSGLIAQKRNITEKDLFGFVWIGDTQLSPDGRHAVFVQTTVSAKREGYDTALYLLDTAQPMTAPRRLTNGPHDGQPRWSPDGTRIAFVRALEKEGKPQPPQLYVLSLAGGEPVQVSAMEKGVGSVQWSPNGDSIAVLSSTPIVPELKKDKKDIAKVDEHKSDVRIITEAVYRANGSGYLDPKEAEQIYVFCTAGIGEKTLMPWQMTAGRFSVGEFAWFPSSGGIYYTSEHVDEPYYELPHNEIYAVTTPAVAPKDEKAPTPMSTLVAKLTFGGFGLAVSPDGRHIAFRGGDQSLTKPRSHQQTDMFVLDVDPGQGGAVTTAPRNLTGDYD